MAYNKNGTKYRAFVWFNNTDIDCEDFTSVNAQTLEALKDEVKKAVQLIESWGFKATEVEYEELIDFGQHSVLICKEVA